MGNVTVDVAASKVAVPNGASETPSEWRAAAVPGSRRTEVPTPERLGMEVTSSAGWDAIVRPRWAAELDDLLLPQAAPASARTPHRAVAVKVLFLGGTCLPPRRRASPDLRSAVEVRMVSSPIRT